jgi:hypothetical protein
MSKKIVILTGNETRHEFFRKYVATHADIEVVASYCEGVEASLSSRVKALDSHDLQKQHIENRTQVERDFFELFNTSVVDESNPVFIPKFSINEDQHITDIIELNPDLIIAYGCSLIKPPLIQAFPGRLINVHLGLSPYYRGSGTNFWPLVNNEPEYVGATFMYMDEGIDTGAIIHQIQADYCWGDTPAQIGNRLIKTMARVYSELILNFDALQEMPQLKKSDTDRYYSKTHFTLESVKTLYQNFENGLVSTYLDRKKAGDIDLEIIQNPVLRR